MTAKASKKRRLTGIQPTGELHIGNYFGAIKPMLSAAEEKDLFIFIANLHSLNAIHGAEKLIDYTYGVTASLLALGLNPDKVVFFRQSDIPEVTELTWILSSFTGFGLLERAHAFKDAQAKKKEVNAGVFIYPVLMAADILLYDAEEVPVGKDQKQHIEMCRDIAGRFNHTYSKEVFTLPDPVIDDSLMVIPGLDGKKMSKSYRNTIEIFEEEASLKKKTLSIVTDSTALEEPKEVEGTTLFDFYKLFTTAEQQADFRKRLKAGGVGWGHAKMELFEVMRDTFAPFREKYKSLRAQPDKLEAILQDGALKARDIAMEKMAEIRHVIGLHR